MLPDRSKRYASSEGDIPRLGLTTNWQLLLLALLVLGLLYLIYPRSALVEQLYEQETLDELTLSYIRNLYRADTRNADAALLLAKFGATQMAPRALESMLTPFAEAGDARQRNQARVILLQTYERMLDERPSPGEVQRIRGRLRQLVQDAVDDTLPAGLAHQLAAFAFRLGMPRQSELILQRSGMDLTVASLAEQGRAALARGDHALAAQYFLLARDRVTDLGQARRLFQQGIDAYLAGALYAQAMRAIEQHLGGLEDDLPTLRYVVRTALVAGEPAQAARYARRLVFRLPSEFEGRP